MSANASRQWTMTGLPSESAIRTWARESLHLVVAWGEVAVEVQPGLAHRRRSFREARHSLLLLRPQRGVVGVEAGSGQHSPWKGAGQIQRRRRTGEVHAWHYNPLHAPSPVEQFAGRTGVELEVTVGVHPGMAHRGAEATGPPYGGVG